MSVESDLVNIVDTAGTVPAIDAVTEMMIARLVNLGITNDNEVSMEVAAAGMFDILAFMWRYERGREHALRHWATVRLFVRIYPYALHWYEYTCKQLCAPGGAWEKRDRSAFEADFA